MNTPYRKTNKRKVYNISPKSLDFVHSELKGLVLGLFEFLDEKSIEILTNMIKKLSLGDPVLVLHWNQDTLAAATALNPTHTKASLVEVITNNGGIDATEMECVFSFQSDRALSACTAVLPLWSRSLGPISAALQGQVYIGPIAEAHVIRATHKVQPDIVTYPFFRTD